MSVAGPAAQSIDLGRPAVSPGHVETRPLHPADSPTMHCSLTQFIELTALHVCHCVFCVVAVVSRAGEMAGRPLCCCGLRDGSGGGRASSTGQRIAKHTRHTRHRQQQQSQGQGQAGPGWTRHVTPDQGRGCWCCILRPDIPNKPAGEPCSVRSVSGGQAGPLVCRAANPDLGPGTAGQVRSVVGRARAAAAPARPRTPQPRTHRI